MGKFFHVLFQVGSTAFQIANASSHFLPPPYGAVAAGVVGAIQGGVAVYHQIQSLRNKKS